MHGDGLRLNESVDGVRVHGYLHLREGASASLVLAHGAGSNCNATLLVALAKEFCASDVAVLRCDLPFRQERPHGPPPRGSGDQDRAGLRAAVGYMRRKVVGRAFLGGHSYGGRQASMLAAEDQAIADYLLLLSYPLHPPRRPDQLRTEHLPQLRTPALFAHGTRDGFGSIAELQQALTLIPAKTELFPVESAGHELLTRKNRDALTREIVERFLEFARVQSGLVDQ